MAVLVQICSCPGLLLPRSVLAQAYSSPATIAFVHLSVIFVVVGFKRRHIQTQTITNINASPHPTSPKKDKQWLPGQELADPSHNSSEFSYSRMVSTAWNKRFPIVRRMWSLLMREINSKGCGKCSHWSVRKIVKFWQITVLTVICQVSVGCKQQLYITYRREKRGVMWGRRLQTVATFKAFITGWTKILRERREKSFFSLIYFLCTILSTPEKKHTQKPPISIRRHI